MARETNLGLIALNRFGHGPRGDGDVEIEQRGKRGLNENLGREIMELHTLGVGSGYTQAEASTAAYDSLKDTKTKEWSISVLRILCLTTTYSQGRNLRRYRFQAKASMLGYKRDNSLVVIAE